MLNVVWTKNQLNIDNPDNTKGIMRHNHIVLFHPPSLSLPPSTSLSLSLPLSPFPSLSLSHSI